MALRRRAGGACGTREASAPLHVRTSRAAVTPRAGRRIRRSRGARREAHVGLERLDVLRAARQGAARADAGDEDVDLAVGVRPDLRARGLTARGARARESKCAGNPNRGAKCARRG
eukprot:4072204-Prymnesium_polylepis.1